MMELDTIFCGDALDVLRTLPDNFVHCCITSPPYYALRDYGVDGQIGREDTPAQYVARLTEVFSEVWRVLRPNGTLWLNIADTYCGTGSKGDHLDPKNPSGRNGQCVSLAQRVENVKAKDMIGIPWMLAFALRDYGWYLRSDIIWQKANPMPESCKDRPSRCYEHIFLMAKSRKYYFNAEAIAEPVAESTPMRMRRKFGKNKYSAGIPGQTHQHLNDYRPNGYAEEDKGIDGLARMVQQQFELDPFTNTLFLFCGRRRDRIKGLYWEKDGFILLYKRLEQGAYQWPRSESEVRSLTPQQYRWLMEGLQIEQPKAHRPVSGLSII